MRAPVNHAVAAVNQPLVPQAHEYLAHGARILLVEGEAQPRPVAGAADHLELLEDRVARFLYEFPDAAHERFAAHVEAVFALGGEALLDHVLCRDAGVVGTREPLGGAAAHPLEADQHVLDDVVERVPHVQHVGDVGGRNHDHVRLAVGPGLEDARIEPPLVDDGLYGPGIVRHSLI